MKSSHIIFLISLIFATSCKKNNMTTPDTKIQTPIAEKKPKKLEQHSDVRVDDYFWLNERENSEVINYLTQENKYNDKVTSHSKVYQTSLF